MVTTASSHPPRRVVGGLSDVSEATEPGGRPYRGLAPEDRAGAATRAATGGRGGPVRPRRLRGHADRRPVPARGLDHAALLRAVPLRGGSAAGAVRPHYARASGGRRRRAPWR